MKCFICSKEINNGYLCGEHANELYNMLEQRKGVINTPDWRHHCLICGEFKERVILDYPQCGLFCDVDIIEEWKRYNSDTK